MRLPARGFHQFMDRGSLGPLQQAQNLGSLAGRADTIGCFAGRTTGSRRLRRFLVAGALVAEVLALCGVLGFLVGLRFWEFATTSMLFCSGTGVFIVFLL